MPRDPKALLSYSESARVEKIRIEDMNANDAVVVLMGRTGSGKSTFIEEATGTAGIVGHGFLSDGVSVIRLSFPELVDSDICFVDTPGFNHPDVEVLRIISDFLNKIYQREIQLSGLLYFHDISQFPIGRSSLETFRLFERLCGIDFRRIVLVTTMWDQATEEVGTKIGECLKCIPWKSLIQRGSSVKRFMKTRESAFEIPIPIFDAVNETNALLLQREMKELGLQLKETTVGRSLYAQVDQRVMRVQELVRHFRTKFQRPTLNSTSLINMQQLVAKYQQVSEELQKELLEMKIQDRRRLFNFFTPKEE